MELSEILYCVISQHGAKIALESLAEAVEKLSNAQPEGSKRKKQYRDLSLDLYMIRNETGRIFSGIESGNNPLAPF